MSGKCRNMRLSDLSQIYDCRWEGREVLADLPDVL